MGNSDKESVAGLADTLIGTPSTQGEMTFTNKKKETTVEPAKRETKKENEIDLVEWVPRTYRLNKVHVEKMDALKTLHEIDVTDIVRKGVSIFLDAYEDKHGTIKITKKSKQPASAGDLI